MSSDASIAGGPLHPSAPSDARPGAVDPARASSSPHPLPARLDPADEAVVWAQLKREPRGAVAVAWRCPCGKPGVVQTSPRLPDGVPFPTMFYLTCPRATRLCSTLEGEGMMAEMAGRLETDPDLAEHYADAHRSYLAARADLAARLGLDVPEIAAVSAGGMPHRVKCLHALLAQALAAGPGVNPLGDEVRAAVGDFWRRPCLGGGTAPGSSPGGGGAQPGEEGGGIG